VNWARAEACACAITRWLMWYIPAACTANCTTYSWLKIALHITRQACYQSHPFFSLLKRAATSGVRRMYFNLTAKHVVPSFSRCVCRSATSALTTSATWAHRTRRGGPSHPVRTPPPRCFRLIGSACRGQTDVPPPTGPLPHPHLGTAVSP
jgi:hypothetical protein